MEHFINYCDIYDVTFYYKSWNISYVQVGLFVPLMLTASVYDLTRYSSGSVSSRLPRFKQFVRCHRN